VGAIAVSVIGVLAGGAFGVVYAIEIEQGMMSTPQNLPAARFVPYMSMSSWVLLALISFFGCIASWTAKPRLVSGYFWAFIAHYIFDLGFLVVTLFFCIKASQSATIPCSPATSTATATATSNPSGSLNARHGDLDGQCAMPLSVANIIVLVVLVLYKVLSTFFIYALFKFRRWTERRALEKEAQEIMQQRPPQEFNYDADTAKNWSRFED